MRSKPMEVGLAKTGCLGPLVKKFASVVGGICFLVAQPLAVQTAFVSEGGLFMPLFIC